MSRPIYLDYNATTPVDAKVLERMMPYFSERFGNPSSAGHVYGWEAEAAVDQAREELAALLGAMPEEITFTAGATDAINLAIKGLAATSKGRHIITAATEHSAVLQACRALERQGFEITVLPVESSGQVDPARLASAIRPDTILATFMWANNETGVLHPVAELARMAREKGVLFMTDATQAVGKVPVSVDGVDLLACSAHKFYGPKGTGCLYVRSERPRPRLAPLIDGGGQERGLRGGTLNTPGIVGMGAAASLAGSLLEAEQARLSDLRDRMEAALLAVPGASVNGAGAPRLPNTTSITFTGVRAANVLSSLREVALSAGSACSSGTGKPSHVLTAMGLSAEQALGTLRISLGRYTTPDEVSRATAMILDAVESAIPTS